MFLLQWIGGICYLLNKIFLALAERTRSRKDGGRRFRGFAWGVYLCGLPFWLLIFSSRRNWIAAAVELSGAASMVVGLAIALRDGAPRWLNRLALICIPIGLGCSLYDVGLMTRLAQWLEVGVAAGFLVGTNRLAKQKTDGYPWFALMNLSCGALMWTQNYPWLALQQGLSLLFVADAYRMARRKI